MKSRSRTKEAASDASVRRVRGSCLCGAVTIEIVYPAFWAWHDHGAESRKAHGAAYATYIGCWKKNVRIAKGEAKVARFEDVKTKSVRKFCSRCGSPLMYERGHSPHMINIPRALFAGRTGREPRYHLNIKEMQDWTYLGQNLVPLKGYPGVVCERPKSAKKRRDEAELADLLKLPSLGSCPDAVFAL